MNPVFCIMNDSFISLRLKQKEVVRKLLPGDSPHTARQDGSLHQASPRRVSEDAASFQRSQWILRTFHRRGWTEVSLHRRSGRPEDEHNRIHGGIQIRGAAHPAVASARPSETRRAHPVRLVSAE